MRSLRNRALAILLVAFLPPIALLVYVLHEVANREESIAYASATRLSRQMVSMQQNLITDIGSTLQVLSLVPDVARGGPQCDSVMANVTRQRPELINVAIANLDGSIRCSAISAAGGINVVDRDYFVNAIRTRRAAIGTYQVGRITGRPTINVGYPILSGDGSVVRVMFAALDLGWMGDLGRRAQLPEGSVFVLLDSQMRVVARFPEGSGYVGRPYTVKPIIDAMAAGRASGIQAAGLDGVERLYSVATLQDRANQIHAVVGISTSTAFASARTLRRRALPALLILMGGTLVVTWLAAQRLILRRLNVLSLTAERIAAGDRAARVGPSTYGRDEIGRFAQTFDAMADSILQQSAVLEQRVNERTAQLQVVNRELESFSYSVSHDLRSPLRSIDGFSQALLEDYSEALDEHGRDYLRRVRAAAQRMSQLIDDLLNLARITRKPLNRERVDLSSMAQEITDELRSRDSEREVEVRIEPGLVVSADPGLSRALLTNLLSNAWKFSSRVDRPRIEVAAKSNGTSPTVLVRDNGAGFDMAYANKLFGAFQRLHTTDQFEGTGVGLATVQRIVNRHGGQVWAEAETGRGATFYFNFGSGS